MTDAHYPGMSRDSGLHLADAAHIRQSVRDILITPIGSRVMRREYGSLLSALIDQPQTPALTGQLMAACYMALLRWEPRIRLTAIVVGQANGGERTVDITGVRQDGLDTPISFTLSLR